MAHQPFPPPSPATPAQPVVTVPPIHFGAWSLPIRVLLKSPFAVLLFVGGFTAATIWGVLLLQHSITTFLSDPEVIVALPIVILRRLQSVMTVLTWAIATPVVVAVVTLPMSLSIIDSAPTIERMLRDTGVALRLATRTIFGAIIRAFYFLIPIFAIVSLYTYLVTRVKINYFIELYSLGAIVVGTPFILRSIPLLIAPFVAVAGILSPYEALGRASRMFRARALHITATLLLLGGAIAGIVYCNEASLALPQYSVAVAGGVVIWYLLSVLATLVIEGITVMYQEDVLKVEENTPAAQLRSRLPTGQEIYIHIQNLHLGKE